MSPAKNKKPVLCGNQVQLRRIRDNDRQSMLSLLTDAEVSKTFLLPSYSSEEEAVPLFERLMQLSLAPDRFVYGIFLQDELIGFLNEVEIRNRDIELGYVISPTHWNRGYATDALGAAIDELFRLGYCVVRAGAFEDNAASLRVMEKCGMVKNGQTEALEYRGAVHNCVYCEIHNPNLF